MEYPLVAIVLLNWNGKKYLEQFLPFLLKTEHPSYSIIVADNGSTDDSVDFLQRNYPSIQIILFKENYGFAKGYNEALKQIQASYYVLLNTDVKVTPGWLLPLTSLLDNNPHIAACQPKILSWHHPQYFEYAGGAGGWLDKYCYPFARGRIFDFLETDEGQYNNTMPVFWASGAALCIRANLFHAAGGFDEYFFAHQEEIDLCWRIQLMGYQNYCCHTSVVYHVGGGTLPKGNSLKTYLNFRNNHIMMYKNLRGVKKWYVILIRAVLDGMSAFKALFTGDSGYFIAVASAHLSFIKWMLMEKKKSIFPMQRNGTLNGLYDGNIAWQHFVKGKKKFSEIVSPDQQPFLK